MVATWKQWGATRPSTYDGFDLLPIGGTWREGRSTRTLEVMDPYRQTRILTLRTADAEDVDEAYRKARAVQPEWAATLPDERRAVLLRVAQLLVERREEIFAWMIREAGSTRVKCELEWNMVYNGTLEAATYPARMTGELLPTFIPKRDSRVYRKPVGVVGVIAPWDFALELSNRSVAPAIATGNAVVLKPASLTPVTGGLLLARLYEEAGLPAGVLSVIVGNAQEVGDPLVTHPIPRLISFTGSRETGCHVGALAGQHLKRACLELGGNAPFLVLDDADVELAADAAVFGKFLNSGQICMSINRILVDRRIHAAFEDAFVERVRRLPRGDPADPTTVIGPMISREQLDRARQLVRQTVEARRPRRPRRPRRGVGHASRRPRGCHERHACRAQRALRPGGAPPSRRWGRRCRADRERHRRGALQRRLVGRPRPWH